MKIQHSIEIDASVDRVWELTMDVEAWPAHTPSMTSVERLDATPLAVGSQARIKQPAQPERVWTVTTFEPRQRFAWSTKAMGTRMTGGHQLEERNGGTTNTLTVDIEGPLAPLMGLLMRRPIRKAIEQENEGFKAWAEGAASDARSAIAQTG
jgi:uncharacterized membrane protein